VRRLLISKMPLMSQRVGRGVGGDIAVIAILSQVIEEFGVGDDVLAAREVVPVPLGIVVIDVDVVGKADVVDERKFFGRI